MSLFGRAPSNSAAGTELGRGFARLGALRTQFAQQLKRGQTRHFGRQGERSGRSGAGRGGDETAAAATASSGRTERRAVGSGASGGRKNRGGGGDNGRSGPGDGSGSWRGTLVIEVASQRREGLAGLRARTAARTAKSLRVGTGRRTRRRLRRSRLSRSKRNRRRRSRLRWSRLGWSRNRGRRSRLRRSRLSWGGNSGSKGRYFGPSRRGRRRRRRTSQGGNGASTRTRGRRRKTRSLLFRVHAAQLFFEKRNGKDGRLAVVAHLALRHTGLFENLDHFGSQLRHVAKGRERERGSNK